MMGDAVYSQEALDRIITELMEANPQSNAAPPASEEALTKLDRRTVDAQMLGPEGKTECSICIDEVKVGDKAVFLPCKHWFHEDCVVLWLKEHNTCPVCRTPIEKDARRDRSSGGPAQNPGDVGSAPHPDPPEEHPSNSSGNSPSQARDSRTPGSGADTPMGRAAADMVSSVHLSQPSRPQYSGQDRLNEALRSVTNSQSERDRERRSRGSTSFTYDTSRLQRRTSHSPTSPRVSSSAEHRARIRQRSPSQEQGSGRRLGGERETRRQSGAGPLSWLRDRFTGNGYNNDNSNRRSSRDDKQT